MKENLTENPCMLRRGGWNFTEDGLGASHRIKGNGCPKFKFKEFDFSRFLENNLLDKAATGSPVIVAHCDGSVRYTDIVHKAYSAKSL